MYLACYAGAVSPLLSLPVAAILDVWER